MSNKPHINADGDVRELGAEFFKRAKPGRIMLDKDVIQHFKKDGKGWQTRANKALRKSAGLD